MQALLVISHWRELSGEDKKTAISMIPHFDTSRVEAIGLIIFILPHALFFGYVRYQMSFVPIIPNGTFGVIGDVMRGLPMALPAGSTIVLAGYSLGMLFKSMACLLRGELQDSGIRFLKFTGLLRYF